jgi:hypothetical protein
LGRHDTPSSAMPPWPPLALNLTLPLVGNLAEYQRRPGEPERPLRTLPFGQAGLVYEPDDLVLVIWTGWHPPGSPCTASAGRPWCRAFHQR